MAVNFKKIFKFIIITIITVFVIMTGICINNLYNFFYGENTPIIEYDKNCKYRLKYIGKVPFYDGVLGTLKDGRVLIKTFYGSNSVEIFDPKTNKFRKLKDKTKVYHENHHSIVLSDGRLLIVDNTGIEVFDPKTEKFTLLNKMITPRIDEAVVYVPPNKVYIIGGYKSKRKQDENIPYEFINHQIEIYNVKENLIYEFKSKDVDTLDIQYLLFKPEAEIINNSEFFIHNFKDSSNCNEVVYFNYLTNKARRVTISFDSLILNNDFIYIIDPLYKNKSFFYLINNKLYKYNVIKNKSTYFASIENIKECINYKDLTQYNYQFINNNSFFVTCKCNNDLFVNQIIDSNNPSKSTIIKTSFKILNIVDLSNQNKLLIIVKKEENSFFSIILMFALIIDQFLSSNQEVYRHLLNVNSAKVYILVQKE